MRLRKTTRTTISYRSLAGHRPRKSAVGTLITRSLGRFLVKGKKVPVNLHELVGPKSLVYGDAGVEPDWLRLFRLALEAFASGNLQSAADLMRQTTRSHDGGDSLAEFYLRYITAADRKLSNGIIQIDEK